jgi:hypothetical protein
MLACLRFADLVTETVARLATGSGGLTLGRAGFSPAGRLTKFHGVIAILQSQSTSIAWSLPCTNAGLRSTDATAYSGAPAATQDANTRLT